MKKEIKETTYGWEACKYPVILALCGAWVLLFFFAGHLDDIEEQLENIPKRVCHIEEEIEWVELGIDSTIEERTFDYNATIICEGDVEIGHYEGLQEQIIWFTEEDSYTKCLIKTKKEVCEVI